MKDLGGRTDKFVSDVLCDALLSENAFLSLWEGNFRQMTCGNMR
jgi:hypothetical protein